MSTLPNHGSDENPSNGGPLYDIIRWITSDTRRTCRIAVLLLITLGAFVAIAAFSSAMIASWLTACGLLCRWLVKRRP